MRRQGWIKRKRQGQPGDRYYLRYKIGSDFFQHGRRVASVSWITGDLWRFYASPEGLRRIANARMTGRGRGEDGARLLAERALGGQP